MDILSKRNIVFFVLFTMLVFIGDKVNFSPIVGVDSQYLTLFQFFGPTAGAILGPVVGTVSVLAAELVSFVLNGKAVNEANLLRLLPMLFAAIYFGTKKERLSQLGIVVPAVCMALFWMNPVGQQAWVYALYWLIPIGAYFFKEKLVLRSLGATFTAHAVGSVIWLYTFPMAPEAWLALIPVVAFERGLFTIGISASYVCLNSVAAKIEDVLKAPILHVDPRYVLFKGFALY